MFSSRHQERSTVNARLVSASQIEVKAEHLDLSVDRCWQMITEPSLVGMWFGDLSADLNKTLTARLDFQDGDFFNLDYVCAQRPTTLTYSWRFLGLGSSSKISWRISGDDGDTTVTLTDFNPERTKDSADELREGWLDFFQRLEKFASSGHSTRYDFRHDFDGGIDLPAPVNEVLAVLHSDKGLLSIATPIFNARNGTEIVQQVGPPRYNSAALVRFDLSETNWATPTQCQLELRAKAGGSCLFVQQSGWDRISSDVSFCMAQRKFYSEQWRAALRATKALIEQSKPVPVT